MSSTEAMGWSVVISPVSAFGAFPIMGPSQQRGQGAGDGDAPTHSGKIPAQGGSLCRHSLPPPAIPPSLPLTWIQGRGERGGGRRPPSASHLVLGAAPGAPASSSIAEYSCRTVSACPGRAPAGCPIGNAMGIEGLKVGGRRQKVTSPG